jgi:hypothetical protein
MYSAELQTITRSLRIDREHTRLSGNSTELHDEIIERAEALAEVDENTLASMVEGVAALVGEKREELLAQLGALGRLA